MTGLCQLIDTIGLTCDDLWSYYEVLGRPAWAVLMPILFVSAGAWLSMSA